MDVDCDFFATRSAYYQRFEDSIFMVMDEMVFFILVVNDIELAYTE